MKAARVLSGLLVCLVLAQPKLLAGDRGSKLLDEILAIEQAHPGLCKSALDAESSGKRIADLAERVRAGMDAVPQSAESAVKALNGILLGPDGIRSSQDLHDPCNLLLSSVLARKQGYCVGVAAVYLSVAEVLELPIYAVSTPSHVFLRYNDQKTRINIETFNGGASVPDEQYISQHRIAPASLKKGVFLEDLTTKRFLAQVHNNLGVIYSEGRQFERAAKEYAEAVRLDRRLPAAWYNSGNDLQAQGQLAEAVRAFTKALHLHPNDAWALNNRGMTYRSLGQPNKALADFLAALRIDPELKAAKDNLRAEARDPSSQFYAKPQP